jgi:hypothetical protein
MENIVLSCRRLTDYFIFIRPQMPPRPISSGLSAGRGHLKPISDDDWGEDPNPEERVTKSSSKASYSAMDSFTSSGTTSPEPSPLPPSGRKADSLEQHIMRNLVTKARRNKASKSSQMPPVYLSSSDSDALGTSTQSSRTYSDSRFTGHSGDDSSSLASSEFSMEETNNRQLVDPFRNNERKSRARAYQQQKGDDSREDEEENKNKRVSVAQKTCFVFCVFSGHIGSSSA